ncbi:2,3-bisphosphoglycerate-independent phosphoglycerate mutase [Clostridiaceae bacterium]|jgi:2,3-bisphosphoglycerate-independent phosphoglycerate mutase|uniref:2,3-bisphosphoglycerate-independent phosphoglycerate mutase n=1 Tax=Luoshenia tenuis TaxID=2763654 RepID=UPI0008212185|nr:2%2C3-bisphosphoglycerate-independent phosphoglycerate mutase [uncultured Clostridium sp.]
MGKKMTALVILDGFGYRECAQNNAIAQAKTPNIDRLLEEYPHTTIGASGMDVGLPDGQMGNSEVGHLNIGAGRIVYQELTRITKSIADGDFFEKAEFLDLIAKVKQNGGKLHLMGLISDGGVHSHNEHLYALIELAKRAGLDQVYVHCFMDGRDVPPSSGKDYIEQLEEKMAQLGFGKIATVMGRYYAMDRDNRWERVEKAYDAMTLGQGDKAHSAVEAMANSYASDVVDEFVVPCVIEENGKPVAQVEKGDGIIFFNFRPDRAREITRAFIDPEFAGFERKSGFLGVDFVSMTQYDATFAGMLEVAFKPQTLTNTFGEYIAKNGKTQLRIAETEKYAHVTFFFNGGVEAPNENEDRALIPSPKVATYDLKPEMSAYEVAEEAVKRIESGKYDVMILNFANPDMVGHTGVMSAAVAAVEAVDTCLGKVLDAVLATGGCAIVTADHGNADIMVDPSNGQPFTAHTTNPVPFILVDPSRKDAVLREGGRLADLAPTLLTLMGLPVPEEMTGTSMIAK